MNIICERNILSGWTLVITACSRVNLSVSDMFPTHFTLIVTGETLFAVGTITLQKVFAASVTTALMSLKYTSIQFISEGRPLPAMVTISPNVPDKGEKLAMIGGVSCNGMLMEDKIPLIATRIFILL